MLKLLLNIALLLLPVAVAQAATYTVTVDNNAFNPRTLTINAGDTVTWVNAGQNHNVLADDTSYYSGVPLSTPWTYSHTFTTATTSRYYCTEHGGPNGAGMSGIITVNSVATAPTFDIGGYTSGSWYTSGQGGHGFLLEVDNAANNMLAIWFVYAPDGSSQNWVYAQGSFDPTKSTVTLPAILPNGAKFPPNFNTADVTDTPWGSLTFSFSDCNNGTVSWTSTLPGYGSGSLPITRLTQIAGTTCPTQ